MPKLTHSLLCLALAGCGDPTTETASAPTSASAAESSTGPAGSSSTTDTGGASTDDTPTTTAEPPVTTGDPDGTSGDPSSTGGTTGAPDSGLVLLVCGFGSDSVGRYDLDTGEHLGDLGPAEDLDGALGITVGPDGQIYVGSEESNMVLRFDGTTGAFVDRFVWDDPATPDDDETGGLMGPGAVVFGPDGDLYVSSFDSDAVLRYDGTTGAFKAIFVEAGAGGLDGPDAGMVFGPDGDLYVPGYYSNTVSRFDGTTGAPLGDFTPVDLLDNPRTLVFQGEHLYVANEGSDEVLRYAASDGAFIDVFVAAGAGGLDAPAGMVFGPDGSLYVASVNNNAVLRYDGGSGEPTALIVEPGAGGLSGPTHIALAPAF